MNDKLKHAIAGVALLMLTASLAAQIVEPVPFDKKWHIACGSIAGVWGTFAGNSIDLSPEGAALFGVAAALVAGVGKELMDVSEEILFGKEHNFDPMDVAATTMGGIIGTGLSYAALKIFKKKPYIYVGNVRNNLTIGVRIII